ADVRGGGCGVGCWCDERAGSSSECEVETAVASASDVGGFEVERFYVDRRLGDSVSARGGLFLMPFGLLNEHHEPTRFYGVQRHFVENIIIPSTWREGGLGFHGNTDIGIGWDAGLTTGVNLANWEANPEDPLYRTPLDLGNS